jgi:hypothetical protein
MKMMAATHAFARVASREKIAKQARILNSKPCCNPNMNKRIRKTPYLEFLFMKIRRTPTL